jgi:hypothetical protein
MKVIFVIAPSGLPRTINLTPKLTPFFPGTIVGGELQNFVGGGGADISHRGVLILDDFSSLLDAVKAGLDDVYTAD